MSRSFVSSALSLFTFASLAFAASSARADEARVVQPEPGQAATAAPAPSSVPITATCSLGDHPGISDAEARTAADVVCHELAKQRATNTAHEVRFGTLAGKTMVTVASRSGNSYDERRVFLSGLDELHVASPRLVSALVEDKPLEETRNVDNVLASETRPSKVQRGQIGLDAAVFGTTAIGASAGASGGVGLGLLYRAGSLGVSSRGRLGGIGSSDDKVALATLDVGARWYMSSSDVSPFVGGGLGLTYVNLVRTEGASASASGVGAHAVVGIELLRTQHVAGSASVRADAPLAAFKGRSDVSYAVPVSLEVGLFFH